MSSPRWIPLLASSFGRCDRNPSFAEGSSAIDDSRKPAGHHAEQPGDPGQQKHWSEGELNRPRHVVDAWHHAAPFLSGLRMVEPTKTAMDTFPEDIYTEPSNI